MKNSFEEKIGIQSKEMIPEWKKRVTIICFLSGFISHLYCMANLLGSDDTIMNNYGGISKGLQISLNGADTGRWLTLFVEQIQSWYRTPVVSGVIIILCMTLIALLVIDILDIESSAGRCLIAVLVEVYPAVQAYMSLYEVAYPISALLCVIAVWILVRSEICVMNVMISSVVLGIALAIFPPNISNALILVLIVIIGRLVFVDDEKNFSTLKSIDELIIGSTVSVIAASVFLLVSSNIIIALIHLETTQYQGASQALSGGFIRNIGINFIQTFKKFAVIGLWKIQIIPELRFTLYVCYAVDVICMLLIIKNLKKTGKNTIIRIILTLACIILIPAVMCSMTLISYGFMYRGQHRLPLLFFLIGTFMLMERVAGLQIADKHKTRAKVLFYVVCCNFALMCYGFFLYDNIGYYNQNHVMEQDTSLCTRILSSLDQTEDFDYSQPVYFLNITSWDGNESPTPMKYDPELYSVIWPVSTTNLYCWGDSSFKSHMINYEGVELEDPADKEIERIEDSGLRDEYESLSSGDYSIIKFEDVWVVVVKTVMPPNVLYG